MEDEYVDEIVIEELEKMVDEGVLPPIGQVKEKPDPFYKQVLSRIRSMKISSSKNKVKEVV